MFPKGHNCRDYYQSCRIDTGVQDSTGRSRNPRTNPSVDCTASPKLNAYSRGIRYHTVVVIQNTRQSLAIATLNACNPTTHLGPIRTTVHCY